MRTLTLSPRPNLAPKPNQVRHDQRGFSVWVGEAELLKAAEVAPPLAPANGWGFALGACGPAPEHAQPGAWHVRGLRLRAGSRLRYADEAVRVSLNGQQWVEGGVTFRYHAAPRVLGLVPSASPVAGGTEVRVTAENLAGADAIACQFLSPDNGGRVHSLATGGTGFDASDGMGGAAEVACLTPTAHPAAEVALGLEVTRAGQRYSTHDDNASSSQPFAFYAALPASATYAPVAGPSAGGTLLNVSLPPLGPALGGVALARAARGGRLGARCRFGDGAAGHVLLTVAASLAADGASLVCRSPQPAALGSAPLQVALNGQDYDPAPALPFAFYAPPSLRAVVPAGARAGETVTMLGEALRGADGYGAHSCKFGETVVAATFQGGSRVVANAWEAESVRCRVPPRGAEPWRVRVRVSINGQDYTAEEIAFSWSEARLGPTSPS